MFKRFICFIYLVMLSLGIFVLSGCTVEENGKYVIYNIAQNYKEVDTDLLDEHFKNSEDFSNYELLKENVPGLLEMAQNITPSSLLDKCAIYRFPNNGCGALDGSTFLVYNEKVYTLGTSFGGHGVTEFAYLKTDTVDRLFFIYSWGSGIHRTMMGLFDFNDEKVYTSFLSVKNEQIATEIVTEDLAFYLSPDKETLGLCYATIHTKFGGYYVSITRRDLYKEDVMYFFPYLK